MRVSASTLLLPCVVVLGMWRQSSSCNTNKAGCDNMRNNAMNLPTAEEKCTGMQQYLTCVQDDIRDCTDNSYTDQYALNLVSTYCNKAYLCSDRLQRCYKNFTPDVMTTIANSDNNTRATLCGSLVTPIMTCQEGVTSDCHDQTGLLETVTHQQASLNAACSETVPCLGRILQCQSSIIDMMPGEGGQEPAQSQGSDCAAQRPVDSCGAYRKALQCMRANLTTCTNEFKVDSIVASLENTTGTVCDPRETCMANVSACLCHINSQGSSGHASVITSICTSYPPFARCLEGLAPECGTNDEVSGQVTALRENYKTYYTLFCTRDGGLCPEAVQCMANLSLPQANPQTSQSARDDLGIANLCYSAGPVLNCLGSTSKVCEAKQGNVTFQQIEANFLDMCIEIAPHVNKLSECGSVAQCMRQYDLFDLGVSATSGSTQLDVVKVMQQMYSGLTKTDFWCSYLSHGYKCVADSAQDCALGAEFAAESREKYTGIHVLCGGGTPAPPTGTTPSPGTNGGNQGTNIGGTKDTDDGNNGVSSEHRGNVTILLAAMTSMALLLRHR